MLSLLASLISPQHLTHHPHSPKSMMSAEEDRAYVIKKCGLEKAYIWDLLKDCPEHCARADHRATGKPLWRAVDEVFYLVEWDGQGGLQMRFWISAANRHSSQCPIETRRAVYGSGTVAELCMLPAPRIVAGGLDEKMCDRREHDSNGSPLALRATQISISSNATRLASTNCEVCPTFSLPDRHDGFQALVRQQREAIRYDMR